MFVAQAACKKAESYGWIFHKPSSKSTVIEYHFIDNEEGSPEFGTVLFGGETSSLYFVAAKCTCGCQFSTEYMMDELSALSNVTCPDCGAETQEVDDSVEWKRISKNFAK